MKIPNELKCRHCGGKAVIIEDMDDWMDTYYYHYSRDYSKGCRQRIQVFNKQLSEELE